MSGGIAQAYLLKKWLNNRGINTLLVMIILGANFVLVILGIGEIISLVSKTAEFEDKSILTDILAILGVVFSALVIASLQSRDKDN